MGFIILLKALKYCPKHHYAEGNFFIMNFKKIKVSETRNAIINLDLLVGIFRELKSEYGPELQTVLRFTNGYSITIRDEFVKEILDILGIDNV